MVEIKRFLKAIIPPVLISIIRRFKKPMVQIEIWSGDYKTWAEAKAYCTGYDSSIILEKCKTSLLKVKRGEAVYERDSVIFDELHYSWGLLAGLQKAALENNGKLCVLDFGGSLGSTYFQNREFLSSLKELQWCIVEQAHFVECGQKDFENDQLKFYYTVEECMENHNPNVLLLSSVLQYLEKPYQWLERLLSFRIPTVILDRTSFVENETDILTIQNVPSLIYEASYPAWFFGSNTRKHIVDKYKYVIPFKGDVDTSTIINNTHQVYWGGLILKL
jgi:putative methyltransferase (TIGR04325 family)